MQNLHAPVCRPDQGNGTQATSPVLAPSKPPLDNDKNNCGGCNESNAPNLNVKHVLWSIIGAEYTWSIADIIVEENLSGCPCKVFKCRIKYEIINHTENDLWFRNRILFQTIGGGENGFCRDQFGSNDNGLPVDEGTFGTDWCLKAGQEDSISSWVNVQCGFQPEGRSSYFPSEVWWSDKGTKKQVVKTPLEKTDLSGKVNIDPDNSTTNNSSQLNSDFSQLKTIFESGQFHDANNNMHRYYTCQAVPGEGKFIITENLVHPNHSIQTKKYEIPFQNICKVEITQKLTYIRISITICPNSTQLIQESYGDENGLQTWQDWGKSFDVQDYDAAVEAKKLMEDAVTQCGGKLDASSTTGDNSTTNSVQQTTVSTDNSSVNNTTSNPAGQTDNTNNTSVNNSGGANTQVNENTNTPAVSQGLLDSARIGNQYLQIGNGDKESNYSSACYYWFLGAQYGQEQCIDWVWNSTLADSDFMSNNPFQSIRLGFPLDTINKYNGKMIISTSFRAGEYVDSVMYGWYYSTMLPRELLTLFGQQVFHITFYTLYGKLFRICIGYNQNSEVPFNSFLSSFHTVAKKLGSAKVAKKETQFCHLGAVLTPGACEINFELKGSPSFNGKLY